MTVNEDWSSARVKLEEVDDGYVTLWNVWRPNFALNLSADEQQVTACVVQHDWWSAMWKLEPYQKARWAEHS